MATKNQRTVLDGFTIIDKRQSPSSDASPVSIGTYAASQSPATLDAALIVQNGAYWTQARLDATCLTDKLHAYRLASADAAGIS